jgi:acyl carrier protein
MTRKEFLASMDTMLELPEGTLTGSEQLDDLEQWNSMAMISFMALADENNRAKLSTRQLAGCTSVSELLELAKVEA